MNNEIYFWCLSVVVFLIIEVISPHLVVLWFAIGGIVAIIFARFGADLSSQIAIFLIISVILLLLLRPIYIKYIKVHKIKTNADSLIGETAVVTVDIDNRESTGLVKVRGQIWSAKSEGNSVILKGKNVEILKIEGVKLVVREE